MTAHEATVELAALLSTIPRRRAPEWGPRMRAGMVVAWAHAPAGIVSGEPLESQPAAVQESVADLVDAILQAAGNVQEEGKE